MALTKFVLCSKNHTPLNPRTHENAWIFDEIIFSLIISRQCEKSKLDRFREHFDFWNNNWNKTSQFFSKMQSEMIAASSKSTYELNWRELIFVSSITGYAK